MDPPFSIELAPGVYMDSAGNITDTPVPNKPLYQPKAGFPVDADAIKRAAEGVAKMLPGTENGKPNKVSSFLSNIGVSADLIGVLGKIADIASVVGTVVPILGFALAVIKFAGLLDNGDDPLKTYISQRFDELEARAKADELKQELDKAAAVLNQFETALTKVEHYANHSTLSSITAATLANDQQSVSQQLDDLFSALGGLLTDLWQFVLTPADYGTTFWVQNNLFCIPDSGVPAPAFIPNTTELVFDYRPQLPLLAFGIQCYLTALKAGLPEYRTVGSSADILRKLALQIDDKLSSMRANCLARTIYKEGDGFLCDPPVVDPSLPLRLKFPGMVVGAWDLREYTDEYLNSVALHDATDHRATLQFKWMPPVGTPPGSYNPPTGKWILSQEEADAANQQSAQDYANLLISSGYMNLLHLSMTLRALSTETDSSETVEGGSYSYRRPQTGIPVTVETDVILSPPVVTTGIRAAQDWEGYVSLTVQPIGRATPITYRIYLRTFPINTYSLEDLPYDAYYLTQYEEDDQDTANQELAVTTYPGYVLAELKLMESTSQQQTQSVTGKAELHASTYDYLAPFDGPNFHSVTDLNHKIAQLRSLGWTADAGASGGSQTAEPLRSLTLSGMAGPLQSLSPGIAFEGKQDGAVLPAGGEKHDIQQKTIEISYSIDWTAQSLSIKLQSRPEDRNYLVYLVVEEQLGVDNLVGKTEQKPQQWLHTAFPMQVVGQLTTVPRSFFDQVTKARQYASKTLSDFAHRYVARAAPRPGEPVSNIGNLQQLSTDKGLLRILKAAEAAAPDLLKKAIQASGKRKRKAAG